MGSTPTTVVAERPDGKEFVFIANGTNWTTDTDVDVKLTQAGASWLLTDSDDTIESYDSSGSLVSVVARNGYIQTLNYGGGHLISVTDSFNRSLQFAYTGNLLHSVTAPGGLVITYGYDSGVPVVFDTNNPTGGFPFRLKSATYSTVPPTSQSYLYEDG